MKFADPKARGRDKRVRLQFTSMIDVVFLLLIFFMTTTTLAPPESRLTSGLQTRTESSGAPADFEPQIVDVTVQNGRPVYDLGGRVLLSKLELTTVLSRLPKETGVFIRVDDRVTVSFAASALQAARDAGFERISYVPAE